jgi:hypothetical protein
MMGVASRKAKRAAASCVRDAGEQCQDLRRSDADRGAHAQPIEPRAFVLERDRASPHTLAHEHDHAVDDQEDGGRPGIGE